MFEVVGFAGELCGEFNIRVGAIILGPWFCCVPYDDMIEPIPPKGSEDAGVVVVVGALVDWLPVGDVSVVDDLLNLLVNEQQTRHDTVVSAEPVPVKLHFLICLDVDLVLALPTPQVVHSVVEGSH